MSLNEHETEVYNEAKRALDFYGGKIVDSGKTYSQYGGAYFWFKILHKKSGPNPYHVRTSRFEDGLVDLRKVKTSLLNIMGLFIVFSADLASDKLVITSGSDDVRIVSTKEVKLDGKEVSTRKIFDKILSREEVRVSYVQHD